MRRALFACVGGLLAVVQPRLDAQSPGDRWLEILESNPANSAALGRLLELTPPEEWPGLGDKLAALPGSHGRLARADFEMRTGGGNAAEILETVNPAELDSDGLLRLGVLWTALGRSDKARSAWETAAANQPDNPSILQRLAEASLAAGDVAHAEKIYLRLALAAEPARKLEALEKLSQVRERLGEGKGSAEASIEALEMLGATHWKFPALAARALDCAEREGMLDELVTRWSGADPATLRRRAALEFRRGNFAAAADILSNACRQMPSEPALADALGLAALAAGRPGQAVESFRTAWKLEPAPARALQLAEALALSGKEEEAGRMVLESGAPRQTQLEYLQQLGLDHAVEKFLRQAGDAPADQRRLIEFLLEQGRNAEARELLEKLPPLEAARILKSRHRLAMAEEFARRAAESRNPEATLLLADILEARGLSALSELTEAARHSDSEALDLRLIEAIRAAEPDEAAAKARLRDEGRRLAEAARAAPSPSAWLRAARWIESMQDDPSPILKEARRAFPENPPLLLALAAARETHGDPDGALEALEAARRLEPTTNIDCEIARIEKLRGNAAAAAAILIRLAEDNPTDFTLAREAAEAREAEGNVFDALRWWEKAFAIAPPHERAPLLHPILNCFSRLGLIPRALAFLENAGPKLPEGIHRREWARAAAVFATENRVLDEWIRRCRMRSTESPSAKLALSELGVDLQNAEDKELIEDLPKLERDENWPRAIETARRLANQPTATLENHTTLARILEKAGEFDEAARQWQFLVARYSRSQATLLDAADFFERSINGPLARKLRRDASRLGPPPPHRALAVAAGLPPKEAAQLLEDLIARLPENPMQDRLPGPLRLEALPSPEPNLRQKALRELGRLRMSPVEKLEALAGKDSVDLVWALSAAGKPCAHIAARFATNFPDEFAALALEEGAYPLLTQWIQESQPPTVAWQRVVAAVGPLLAQGWQPDPAKLLEFFQKAPAFARRDLAQAAAATGHFRLAVAVGIPEGLPAEEEGAARLETAKWCFQLLDIPAGLSVLAGMPPPASESLDDPFYEALRIRTLLLHPVLPAIPDTPAARVLAAALAQNRPLFLQAAQNWLTSIEPMREAGILESWNMHEAAGDLLATAWKLRGDRQCLDALAALRISRFAPARASQLVHEWLRLGARPEMVLVSAAQAASLDQVQTAREILEALIRRKPDLESAWGQLAALPGPLSESAREMLSRTAKDLPEPLRVSLSRKLPVPEALRILEGIQSEISKTRAAELENAPGPAETSPAQKYPLHNIPRTRDEVVSFLNSRPAPDELAGMAQRMAGESPDLVRSLDPETAARFFPRPLHSRFLRNEIAWAKIRNNWAELEAEWAQYGRRGNRIAWEGLVLAALARDADPIPAIENFLLHAHPSPSTLASLAEELLKNGRQAAAEFVLDKLHAHGLPGVRLQLRSLDFEDDPARREGKLRDLERLARWDLSLREPLAAFFSDRGETDRAEKVRRLPFGPAKSEIRIPKN